MFGGHCCHPWERELVRVVRVETELGSGLERHSEVKEQDLVILNIACERARLSVHRFQNCWSGRAVKELHSGIAGSGPSFKEWKK